MAATKAEKLRKLRSDYEAVFTSPAGQAVLRDLMAHGHFFEPSFAQGNPDVTSFNEGERNIVNYILAMVQKNNMSAYEIMEANELHIRETSDPIESILNGR